MATPPPKQPRPVPVKVLNAQAAVTPWWWMAPSVAYYCAVAAFFPFKIVVYLAEVAIAGAIVAVFGTIGAWYMGYIPDQTVAAYANEIGTKILAIVQAAGVF